MNLTEVIIVIDRQEDIEFVRPCREYLDHFGIRHEVQVLSLRDSDGLSEFVSKCPERGIKLFIAAAGNGAQSASLIAAKTLLPVIAIPLANSPLLGNDALYMMTQTPEGLPLAAVSIGAPGARNAAILAAQILALSDNRLKERLRFFKQNGCRFS